MGKEKHSAAENVLNQLQNCFDGRGSLFHPHFGPGISDLVLYNLGGLKSVLGFCDITICNTPPANLVKPDHI